MDFNKAMNMDKVDFKGIPSEAFLLGLLSAFDNRYQAGADRLFKEITWKQFFAIICIGICKENPTISELSEVMGSSHQNVKQILLKLEKQGFVKMGADKEDRRKQRVFITKECEAFCNGNAKESEKAIKKIFEGIDEKNILTTIQTIMIMERNVINL